jgi:phosphoadenosine phosphosulfate reductase
MLQNCADPLVSIRDHIQIDRLSPQQTVHWAVETFGSNLIMTSAFGLAGVALIHMLHSITNDVPIVFVDTGFHFPETLETKHRLQSEYGLRILTYQPLPSAAASAHPSNPDLCCALRKIEPMQRALAELQPSAILNARAQYQASTRQNLPSVEWTQIPIRINPLALWKRQKIEDYIRVHHIPHNPLYHQGYPSVGCRPCTRPVADGEEIRAGRWAGTEKVECGLWTHPVHLSSGSSNGHIIPRREVT